MNTRIVGYLASVILTAGLVHNVSAQDYNWSGAGDGTTWSQGANWVQLAPPPANTHAIFIGTGFPTTSPLPLTIGASDAVQLSDTLFGPEWGQTLSIYGSVNAGFGFAPVGDMAGPKSTVNLYGNGSLSTGDSIFIGDMFWFNGAPHVDMNLYGNSSVTTKYLAVGGHLNIFGGTVTVNNALLTGTATAGAWGSPLSTDTTRLIDIAGGRLVVVGDATAQVNDLIARGVMQGNGVIGNVNVDLLSDPGFTVITAVPEPGTLGLLALGGLGGILFRRRLAV
jgi:hypothetical protein